MQLVIARGHMDWCLWGSVRGECKGGGGGKVCSFLRFRKALPNDLLESCYPKHHCWGPGLHPSLGDICHTLSRAFLPPVLLHTVIHSSRMTLHLVQ